jgi:hypothetical protein
MQERTERLGFASDNMDRLEETSSGWARDVNKYVQNQKKKAVLGGKCLARSPEYFGVEASSLIKHSSRSEIRFLSNLVSADRRHLSINRFLHGEILGVRFRLYTTHFAFFLSSPPSTKEISG